MRKSLRVVLTVLLVAVCSPRAAQADNLDISFTNSIGGVIGTVTAEIEGLTAGTTGPASSVILLSYPSALDPEIADAGTNLTAWTFQDVNSFTLNSSGKLVAEDFDVADCPVSCGAYVDAYTLDSITPPLPGEYPTPSPIDFLGYGPYTQTIGLGPYPDAVATVPARTPEPSSLALMLAGVGFSGLLMVMRQS